MCRFFAYLPLLQCHRAQYPWLGLSAHSSCPVCTPSPFLAHILSVLQWHFPHCVPRQTNIRKIYLYVCQSIHTLHFIMNTCTFAHS